VAEGLVLKSVDFRQKILTLAPVLAFMMNLHVRALVANQMSSG